MCKKYLVINIYFLYYIFNIVVYFIKKNLLRIELNVGMIV